MKNQEKLAPLGTQYKEQRQRKHKTQYKHKTISNTEPTKNRRSIKAPTKGKQFLSQIVIWTLKIFSQQSSVMSLSVFIICF